jgi:hypothetical protein
MNNIMFKVSQLGWLFLLLGVVINLANFLK